MYRPQYPHGGLTILNVNKINILKIKKLFQRARHLSRYISKLISSFMTINKNISYEKKKVKLNIQENISQSINFTK